MRPRPWRQPLVRHARTLNEDPIRSMDLQIRVDPRTVTGKHTKRLRAAGGARRGLWQEGRIGPVQLDAKALDQLYREAGRTSVVKISVDGGETTSVVIKSIQRHPLTGRALHVDFFAPDLTHEMTVDVPIVFVGEPPGVEATGGFLLTSAEPPGQGPAGRPAARAHRRPHPARRPGVRHPRQRHPRWPTT